MSHAFPPGRPAVAERRVRISLEHRARVELALKRSAWRQRQSKRAADLLHHIASPSAREVLQSLAQGAAESQITRLAQEALERLGQ
jgi:hypothetical protein